MVTKDDERKALKKIRDIIDGLGGNESYIGMALEGCLEIAESNIDNDFGESMLDRFQCSEKRLKEKENELSAVKDQQESLKKDMRIILEISNVRAQEIGRCRAEVNALRKENLELKGRLYDILSEVDNV